MQDLLLVAAVAAMFLFGWFLMKRLDCFLEKNHQAQTLLLESGKDTLRIGFSNPSIADSISDVLERYSKRCSGISVYLFHGTEHELIKQLFHSKSVMMKYGGLPIESIAKGHIMQKVLWSEETKTAFVDCFVECLKDELDAPKPQ